MTTLRERRHQQCVRLLERSIALRDDLIARLIRNDGNIKSLRRKVARYEKPPAVPMAKAKPTATATVAPAPAPRPAPVEAMRSDDLAVPDFLRRAGNIGKLTPADLKARADIEAAEAERKRVKARGRIATMKAKQRGDMKRMPLQGKAALAAIAAAQDK